MVFKRRDRRPVWQIVFEALYPRGGWRRAFNYVKHRVRRLPDTPEKIGRGIWAGVFTVFSPFYGLHFLISVALAKILRGNILAALLATFFGNPLTYLPIGVISLTTGHFLMGRRPDRNIEENLVEKFSGAGHDIWHNIQAMFGPEQAEWTQLSIFAHDVLVPYTVGGIIPGAIAASIMYYLTVPVIRAYQNRRRRILRAKLDQLKKNPGRTADGGT